MKVWYNKKLDEIYVSSRYTFWTMYGDITATILAHDIEAKYWYDWMLLGDL